MPNHVTNRCTITGSAEHVAAFKKKHCVAKEKTAFDDFEAAFDFETIRPMPAILLDTESPNSFGYELVTGRLPRGVTYPDLQRSVLNATWVQTYGVRTIDELCAYLLANEPELHERLMHEGALAVEAEKQTGYTNWYDWAIAKWGTQWNSYWFRMIDEQDEKIIFKFDTAWSAPAPIFELMAAIYPSLRIDVAAIDEDTDYAWTAHSQDGFFPQDKHTMTDADYEAVYGHPRGEFDEDEDHEDEHDEDEEESGPAVASAAPLGISIRNSSSVAPFLPAVVLLADVLTPWHV